MPLREIAGPAGRLEALLDEPAPPGAHRRRRPASAPATPSGAARGRRLRASAHRVRRHDAHQGRVSGGEGAEPHRLRRAALQLPRRRRERRAASTTAPARWTTSAPRSTSCTSAIPDAPLWAGGHVVRLVGRADGRRRGSARVDAHRHRAAGRPLRLRRRSQRSTKPKFFIHGERDEICPAQGRCASSTRAPPSRRSSSSSTAPIICSTARSARSPTPSKICWGIGHCDGRTQVMHDAVIVSAVRTAVGKAPNGTLRGTRPDELAAAVIAEALERAPGIDPARDRRRDPRLRDAGSRAGLERRAHRQPARRHSGRGVGGDRQPLLLVRPAGDRLRRRAHHVRLRVGDRRRRHRVDEPGADGRPQGRAEPDAGRLAIRTCT